MSGIAILIVTAIVIASCGSDSSSPSEPDNRIVIEFSDLSADEVTSTRALISFTTDQPTTCFVEYGTNRDSLNMTATDLTMGENELSVDHSVMLEDLSPETTYYYRGMVTDSDGVTYRSETGQFITLPDTSPSVLTNIALLNAGTTVVDVSSNYGNGANDSSWGAYNSIDGLMSSEWSSYGDGNDAFITLDFGDERTVVKFGFRSRKMSNGTAIITGVRLIFDGDTVAGPFETPDPDTTYTFDLEPPVVTGTVRIEAVTTTGGNTGAKEIQFFSPEE
ncbi:fibronectin type III domain-containing protein [Candidatus Latescibacterota bacterium]